MKQEMICITCPMSCHLLIEVEGKQVIEVTGNTCPRGKEYAINEMTNPVRVLTSTVIIENALYPRLPVITSKPIPKDKMMDVMREIDKIKVQAPINVKDVIIQDVCSLGVDILASRSMNKMEHDVNDDKY